MYKKTLGWQTTISLNTSYQGERLEEKIFRITNNKEPISEGAPLIYDERQAGVPAANNVRTDRWEIALDATDAIAKAHIAKRAEFAKSLAEKNQDPTKGGNPTQATEPK